MDTVDLTEWSEDTETMFVAVIAKTRLAPNDLAFVDRCALYLRQFGRPGDWPMAVTLAE